MDHRKILPMPNGVDLYQIVEGDRHEYVGPYPDERAAKQASRIAFRGGARSCWLATDRHTGLSIVQWDVVGDPTKAHRSDCVDRWRADSHDPEPPTAGPSVMTLPVVRNRVAFLLQRLGRREAA